MAEPSSSPHRLAALLSLTAAMVLTGANVVLGKIIVAEVPVYLFMLFRFLVSTAALLPLGAVACEASFVLLGKRLTPPYRPLRLALGANLVGLAGTAPLALLSTPFDLGGVSPPMWLLATWYALSASVFCLWLWYRGLPYVETWLAGLTTAAVPVTALTAAALVLAETLDASTLAGGALVLAAIVLGALP